MDSELRQRAHSKPRKDRRAAPGSGVVRLSLRRLRSLVTRPLRLSRRGVRLRLGFVERRQAPEPVAAGRATDGLADLRAELRARVLDWAPDDAVQVMHQLLAVEEALGRRGWPGVAVLPAPVLGHALLQAGLLVKESPSPPLDRMIDELRRVLALKERQVQRDSRRLAGHADLEVSEASRDELDEFERCWLDSLPEAPAQPSAPGGREGGR